MFVSLFIILTKIVYKVIVLSNIHLSVFFLPSIIIIGVSSLNVQLLIYQFVKLVHNGDRLGSVIFLYNNS